MFVYACCVLCSVSAEYKTIYKHTLFGVADLVSVVFVINAFRTLYVIFGNGLSQTF